MAQDDASFFTRWSRRKVDARVGTTIEESLPTAVVLPIAATPVPALPDSDVAAPMAPAAAMAPPPPTMDDVALLTGASDYSRFVQHQVSPEVRNAALKKLFAEPQFNVMDGLDIYVGDYSQPDPMPAGMLRQMVQSKMLGLFAEEDAADAAAAAALVPSPDPDPVRIAASAPPESAPHEDTDLQLQPDDDAGRAGAEPGPEEDPGRQR